MLIPVLETNFVLFNQSMLLVSLNKNRMKFLGSNIR